MANVEGPVIVNPPGTKSSQAPKNNANNNQWFTPKTVAQPACERCGEHVKNEQSCSKRAHLLIGNVELALDKGLRTRKDVPIYVVEQVERDEQQERPQGGVCTWAKGCDQGTQKVSISLETAGMTTNVTMGFPGPTGLRKGQATGRGQRASTVVPMPPRGRNSPRTTTQTGLQALTTSSRTWLTIFSWKIPRLR